MIISIPVVAALLKTKWTGYTTIFGNWQWGKGNTHFAYPTKTYLEEFLWLVWRNPVNNLLEKTLAVNVNREKIRITGDIDIGDKIKGGFYGAKQGWKWEYYWIYPYSIFKQRRCVRVRIGWKLLVTDGPAAFVFAVNPWKKYLGK